MIKPHQDLFIFLVLNYQVKGNERPTIKNLMMKSFKKQLSSLISVINILCNT